MEKCKYFKHPVKLGICVACSQGKILVVCSYCKKFIEAKDGQGVSGVSHGICPSCKDKVLEELR